MRIVSTRKAYQGYVTVTVVTLDDGDGDLHQREVISFGHAVCVLPYDPERKVAMLVRLPRAPLLFSGYPERLTEALAGMIDAGEQPEATAAREALEETGLVLARLETLGAAWSSPGVVAERTHLFLAPYGAADRQGAGGGLAHEHEGIVAEEVPLAELWRMTEAGQIEDMKTLALVYALRVRRPELFE